MRVIADDGAVLALRIDGPNDAPALVLLHSIGCDSSMWDAEANALKQQFRVIRLDTRGHGSSSVPSGDYTLERLGRDVLVALDMVGVAQAHVCGLSMGGMVAQWLAVHTPARVDRLILADTAARIGTPESWQARRETVRAQGWPRLPRWRSAVSFPRNSALEPPTPWRASAGFSRRRRPKAMLAAAPLCATRTFHANSPGS